MFFYTHLVIGLFFSLLFRGYFDNQYFFIFVVLISSILPDIDTKHSIVGKSKLFRPFQFFVKHRGIIHSFIFLISFSLFLLIFSRTLSFGFFLGYGLHLVSDKIGVKTGSFLEGIIFILFFVLSIVFEAVKFFY